MRSAKAESPTGEMEAQPQIENLRLIAESMMPPLDLNAIQAKIAANARHQMSYRQASLHLVPPESDK